MWVVLLVVLVHVHVHVAVAHLSDPDASDPVRDQQLAQLRAIDQQQEEQAQLRAAVDQLRTVVDQLRAAFDQQQTEHAQLRAVIDQQQAQLRAVIDQQQYDHAQQHSRLLDVNKRQVSAAIRNKERRALSTTCEQTSNPRLFVQGVCTCTDDVLIGDLSVQARLDNLTATVAGLSDNSAAAIQAVNTSLWDEVRTLFDNMTTLQFELTRNTFTTGLLVDEASLS